MQPINHSERTKALIKVLSISVFFALLLAGNCWFVAGVPKTELSQLYRKLEKADSLRSADSTRQADIAGNIAECQKLLKQSDSIYLLLHQDTLLYDYRVSYLKGFGSTLSVKLAKLEESLNPGNSTPFERDMVHALAQTFRNQMAQYQTLAGLKHKVGEVEQLTILLRECERTKLELEDKLHIARIAPINYGQSSVRPAKDNAQIVALQQDITRYQTQIGILQNKVATMVDQVNKFRRIFSSAKAELEHIKNKKGKNKSQYLNTMETMLKNLEIALPLEP